MIADGRIGEATALRNLPIADIAVARGLKVPGRGDSRRDGVNGYGMTESGLRAVFLNERPMLMRLLVARLGNREDAEDALQDMWLRLDQLAARPVAEPAGYLYRIAANLATDRRISGLRRGARDHAWFDSQPLAEELPDAERALIARERLDQIEALLAAMPERMRTAFRMFRFEEQPQRAIATHLGISLSGVEKLLQRAWRQIHAAGLDAGEDVGSPRRLGTEEEWHRGE
jgi:RNA polymerase sigma-70 factor (ECF subfamily)